MPRVKKRSGKLWRRILIIFLASTALILGIGLAIASVYKKEIITLVNDELKSALHTEASIGDADITFLSDFPNITLLLKDVTIGKDSVSNRELLIARRIHLNLRTIRLLFGNIEFRSIRLDDADILIFRTANGFSNLDFLKREDTVASSEPPPLEFDRQRLILENCKVAFHDSLKAKYYDVTFNKVDGRLNSRDSVFLDISAKGPIHFAGLTFNPAKGAFLHGVTLTVDLQMTYRRDSSILEIVSSTASAPAGQVAISGKVKLSQPRHMQLRFATEKVEYGKGIAVLADTIRAKLAKLNITGPMKVQVDLQGDMIPGVQPAVDIAFNFPGNRLTGDKIDVTHLSLNGEFSNHVNESLPYDNANTVIYLKEIQGEIDGLPFHAEATLINPADLQLKLHSIHAFPLSKLNDQADTTLLKFTAGSFSSEFRYEGKLKEYLDPTTTRYTGKLDGTMSIKDGALIMASRKLQFTNLHTSVHFTEDTVVIKSLGVKSGKSSVEVNGTVLNYVPLFVQPEGKGYVKLNINAPLIDLPSLITKQKVKTSAAATAKQKKKVSDMLDVIVKNLQFDVRFNVARYQNKAFVATKLSGDIRLKGTSLEARRMKMDFGRGTLAMNASIRDLQKKVNPVEMTAIMKDVDIKDLFTAFDNFGQKVIKSDNLQGSINMDAKMKMSVDDDFNVILPTLKGQIELVVLNGRLVEFEPLQKMSNFLFKKRDFNDVKFAQINANFSVVNRDLDIERMEVESTVLTLFVEGKYSLDNRTDLTIQVPLSNLKKRDKSYVPQRVGEDAKVGPSVFLRAQSNDQGQTDISYVLFNKKKKKGK